MNWGKGISIVLILFVIGILSVVSYIISLDFYLVNNNHYEEGVNYQQTIDGKKRADELDEPIIIFFDEKRNVLKVVFPEVVVDSASNGTMTLYRPNDSSMDLTIPIEFSAGNTHVIPMERMAKGKWTLTIRFTMNDEEYIKIEEILH